MQRMTAELQTKQQEMQMQLQTFQQKLVADPHSPLYFPISDDVRAILRAKQRMRELDAERETLRMLLDAAERTRDTGRTGMYAVRRLDG
jgi:hypothetical protein